MDEIRARSWLHLQELLYEESWKEQLGRFRSDLVFRGHEDAAGDLSTSLARLGGDYAALEPHLLRNFLDQANVTERVLFPGLDCIALWLTRHYAPQGVPIESRGRNRA